MTGSAFDRAAETPITYVIVIAYLTLAVLTGREGEAAEALAGRGVMVPLLVAEGEPWRLLSYAFLHAGLVHLAFNTLALLWVGPALERELGWLRYVVLYVTAAVGGSVCVALTNAPDQPVVGGSGALFGMFGAAVALHVRVGNHALEFLEAQGPKRLLGLIAINLVLGFVVPRISNAGHIGGLIAGFVVTLVFFRVGGHRAAAAVRTAFAVCGAGLLFYALVPVVRWDWLWNQGVAARRRGDEARGVELQRAAELSARWRGQLQRLYDATRGDGEGR